MKYFSCKIEMISGKELHYDSDWHHCLHNQYLLHLEGAYGAGNDLLRIQSALKSFLIQTNQDSCKFRTWENLIQFILLLEKIFPEWFTIDDTDGIIMVKGEEALLGHDHQYGPPEVLIVYKH